MNTVMEVQLVSLHIWWTSCRCPCWFSWWVSSSALHADFHADFNVSLAFGSYNGEGDNEPLESVMYGIGGNLTLFNFLFYEGHVGIIGAGTGGRGFGGVSMERFFKGLNLPFNMLIGAEGFLTTKADEKTGNSTFWGGLGLRLDYSF